MENFEKNCQLNYKQQISMKIIIAGGGIAGLTSALMAKKTGYIPIVCEKSSNINVHSFGGGIGLWPPSQIVMKNLGLLETIKQVSAPMPSAAYYNKNGFILAKPSEQFGQKFPVLCLQRKQLCQILMRACEQQQIDIRLQAQVVSYNQSKQNVTTQLSNGQLLKGSLLIGADGINSPIRSQMMKKSGMPLIEPHHCGYAYFRAVVNVSTNLQSNWHDFSFESWGDRKRFGFIPLKYPYVFWFVSIPIGQMGLESFQGSHVCDSARKQWISNQFSHWKGPIDIKTLLEMTAAQTILRTDIRKIKGIKKIPWISEYKKVILLGDSANATAPNLAQGAGLAIQSAWDLFSTANIQQSSGLSQYVEKRKNRAQIAQNMSDMVAKIGQLSSPYSYLRDFFMRTATKMMPITQQTIFQNSVKYCLGGSLSNLYWEPSFKKEFCKKQQEPLLGRMIGMKSYKNLPQNTQNFRYQPICVGDGEISIEAHWLCRVIGLPGSVSKQPFSFIILTQRSQDGRIRQKWTRVFQEGKYQVSKFETYHNASVFLPSKNGIAMTQTLGFGPDILRLGFNVQGEGSMITGISNGLWLRDFHLPLPSFICPSSRWMEHHGQEGWKFFVQVNFPKILGGIRMMKYEGKCKSHMINQFSKKKTVVICGGSGMIGKQVCKKFYQDGWKVIILSRNKEQTQRLLPYCQVYEWQKDANIQEISQILDSADAIINLVDENAGGGFWTKNKKQQILQSRINAIRMLANALQKCKFKNKTFIQASDAGIYGDRGLQILTDISFKGSQKTFRVSSWRAIEEETRKLIPSATIARIGHVFSSEGGLFPLLKAGSFFGVKNIGSRRCYIPWVHVQDVASAFLFTANSQSQQFKSKNFNIASPQNATYEDVFKELAKRRGRENGYFTIPEIVLKGTMGEISSVVLQSQRMQPQFLCKKGFTFKYKQLSQAITSEKCI